MAEDGRERLEEQLMREIVDYRLCYLGREESRQVCRICRVNESTRAVDPSEYDPQYVSIGPYQWHPRDPGPLPGDNEKIASLDAVINPTTAEDIVPYIDLLGELVPRAKSFYTNWFPEIVITRSEFAHMLLLDGCYILHKFVKRNPEDGVERYNDDVPLEVERDVLYLISNQIPFFVLEEISQKAGWTSSTSALVDAFISYINKKVMRQQEYAVIMPVVDTASPSPSHLLHLLYMYFFTPPPKDDRSHTPSQVHRWRRAMEYQMSGVDFRKRELEDDERRSTVRSILDVELSDSTLNMPTMNIDNETWRILRNLTALEQYNPGVPQLIGSRVTAYCMFLSHVACTAEDVSLLSQKGVLQHQMGDHDQCAKCLADLCKGVIFDVADAKNNYLWGECQQLDQRFRSPWYRSMAWLQRRYFSNPWLAVGLLSAAVALAATVLQTVYSVLSYYKSNPSAPTGTG